MKLHQGSTDGKHTGFFFALLHFDLFNLLSMYKSGKDFQVLYFVHSVHQDLIGTVVWSAGIPGGTPRDLASYQLGASSACAPGAAPALT